MGRYTMSPCLIFFQSHAIPLQAGMRPVRMGHHERGKPMRLSTTIIAALAAVLAAAPAAADEGRYAASLKAMLTQTAAGTCPADLMGDQLLAACREQLPNMQPGLAAAGAVTAVEFVSANGEGTDRVETYTVRFAKGSASVWAIGKFRDGKYQSAYSTG